MQRSASQRVRGRERAERVQRAAGAGHLRNLRGVDAFPDYPICDSKLLPLMARPVRTCCAAFPDQARRLVRENGVEFETFQALLEKAERNPLYRWKLARAVAKLKKRQAAEQRGA